MASDKQTSAVVPRRKVVSIDAILRAFSFAVACEGWRGVFDDFAINVSQWVAALIVSD
jgi:hypothetical protein